MTGSNYVGFEDIHLIPEVAHNASYLFSHSCSNSGKRMTVNEHDNGADGS